MYKQIVVPLDGSDTAEQALAHAQALAQRCDASLLLLRAVIGSTRAVSESATPLAPELSLSVARRRQRTAAAAAERYLEGVAQRIGDGDLHVTTRVASGPPEAAILEAIEAEPASLICMASHGRGGLARLLHGSVADTVIQDTTVPVLIVPVAD